MTARSFPLIGVVSLCLCLFSSLAAAQPVLLWGVTQGCELDKTLSKSVKLNLESAMFSTLTVNTASAGVEPAEAAARLRASCPSVSGQLLGGMVEPQPDSSNGTAGGAADVQRFRLWLYDLGTGQTAYLDDWCNKGCNLADELGHRAIGLADRPRFGAVSMAPQYCAPVQDSAAQKPRSARVTVMVYGEAKGRSATVSAIKQSLSQQGREAAMWPGEPKIDSTSMNKLAKADPSGQVLGVELTDDGAELFVFDAIKHKSFPAKLRCKECTRDELPGKVAFRAVALLDEVAQPDPVRTPPEAACTPFAFAQCGGAGSLGGSVGIDPKLATTLKGLTWGMFAASAATGIGLAAANATSIADLPGRRNTLGDAAWTALGISGVVLSLAIPSHVLLSRAESRRSGGNGQQASSAGLTCPN